MPDRGREESASTGSVRRRLRGWVDTLVRASGPLPRPHRRSQIFDLILALVLAGASFQYAVSNASGRVYDVLWGLTELRPAGAGVWLGLVLITLLSSLPLVLRRKYPLAVLWFVMASTAVAPTDAVRITFYALVVATYSVAAYSPYRILALVSLPVALLVLGNLPDGATSTVPDEYVPVLVLVPLAFAANGLRTWRLRNEEGQSQLAAMADERAEALSRAVRHERARIARELHDVVTHNVSVMVIQAGAARKVMASNADQARDALLAVETSGRSALSELGHVMGLLTMDAEDAPSAGSELAPQPGLDNLDELVSRLRDTGVTVDLSVTGRQRRLPDGIELAAYRVVQEGLTNMVKHAVGAVATVRVNFRAHVLEIEVSDTGGSSSPAAAAGNGRGLIGLRERLAVYGGTVEAGPCPAGGYQVRAAIPLEEM